MSSQLTHADLFAAANEVCTRTITDVEGRLEGQRASDATEAIRHQEMDRNEVEIAKLAAEHDAREKQERLEKMEQDRLDIEAAEHDLHMRKQALHHAQQVADAHHNDDDDDDDDDDDGSVATPEGHPVSHKLVHSIYS